MSEEDELEELRNQRMEELQEDSEAQEEAVEQQKQQLWQKAKSYMTEGAIDRLSNIKTVDEEKAYSVAQQIVMLGERREIEKVDDDQMKDILREIQKDKQKNQSNIKFRK